MADGTQVTKKTKKRSSSYPAFTLQESVEAARTLKTQLGDGPYSRVSAAVALGYSGITGSSSTKISSCVQFGLLDKSGSVYSQSKLARDLSNPIDDDDYKSSLLTALQSPVLYQKLLTEYDGKSLPTMIESILVRNYGIQENAAKSAAEVFRSSAEYAGVLVNGVISLQHHQSAHSVNQRQVDMRVGAAVSRLADMDTRAVVRSVGNATQLPVTIPNTAVTILFPQEFAYFLSIGAFRQGIEQLAKDISAVSAQQQSTDEAISEDKASEETKM